ncbi:MULTISPECIES: peptidylprolyl isomerase [Halorhodospira]|uniref:peptidylprolyl isomerase n=1 Tax=Halorhodospira TaxID=85108 RepID=UPI001EE95675|nr:MULTISPECIES: peptidylprolyl isomerase [Halorhodospira]MCG5528612.1 SurA N-terminal domain-containing protein [Halorhodospira halophila]MCG5543725.1 SurA N-terminal domain-containing protein [Halorhodospira sp. 9628]
MLQAIRDGIKGWIAWVIIGFIALPFIFMGGYEYFGGGREDAVVARVDGEEIPRSQINQAVERQRAQLREMFGGDLPDGAFDAAALRREALEQLIDERLLHAYVDRQGLRVTDQEVAQTIRSQEIFHEGGQFSRGRYQTLLERNRMTPEDYEELVRRDLKADQFQQAVFASSISTPSQLDRLVRLQDESRSFSYLELAAERYIDEVRVDDAEVEAHYEANTDDYMAPEAVRLEYVELGPLALRDQVEVDDDALRERYDERYGDDEDPPAFDAVREELLADYIREQHGTELMEAGDEFGNIAFEQPDSLEPLADTFGLEIRSSDWIDREGGEGIGELSGVVEQAFSEDVLEYGYNSDLIRADEDRYLVVRLLEHREAEPRPLEEVADSIREEIRQEHAAELALERAEELMTRLRDGESLDELAEELDVERFTVEEAYRDDRSHPAAVVREAFALEEGGHARVELEDGAAALLRLDGISRGDPDGLSAQEREQLQQQLQRMAGGSEVRALIRALRAEADIEIARERL